MKTTGYTTECVINPVFNYTGYHYDVSKISVYNEWTLYATDHPTSYSWAVYVQKSEMSLVVSSSQVSLKKSIDSISFFSRP